MLDEPHAELLYTLIEPTTVDIRCSPTRNATPRVVKCRRCRMHPAPVTNRLRLVREEHQKGWGRTAPLGNIAK